MHIYEDHSLHTQRCHQINAVTKSAVTTACTHSAVTKYLVCGYALIHVPNTGHLTYLCTRYDVLDIYIHSDVNVYMYTQ